MVIGLLQPLEFTDCLLDSPEFRENLNRHEKELDKTSQQIKRIIKEVKDLLAAAKNLSRAQRTLSKSLIEFNFECIGSQQTDDEQVIVNSLKEFGKVISNIEDERDKLLSLAQDQIVQPLEIFRKEHIGGVKENKKKFDKKTAKFCQHQERFLNMSSKKPENAIQEADATLGMLEREYLKESLSYVFRIQDVQERIKFEFVEILLSFMRRWLVFYHVGHEVAEEEKDYMTDLQLKVQKTRENFKATTLQAEELKDKYMDSKMKFETEYTKQGYLFLMEKKAFAVNAWSKYYCTYKKSQKQFTMLQYNQMSGKTESIAEVLHVDSCIRRASEFEKRYCFDVTFEQKSGQIFTYQALSEEDRKSWMNAMDGKEPTYLVPGKSKVADEFLLDEVGFAFARKCIEVLENRGLDEEGLYRIGGVGTKITKLVSIGMDRKKTEKERFAAFDDEAYSDLQESKTIASAIKSYLRSLNEPLMSFRYHNGFIAAAKQETRMQRISDVHTLIYRLPKQNFEMLEIVIRHLKAVSMKCHKNKMSVFNLGVVFGPTLLRSVEETLASILDIKFNNVVIEILIENYDLIFKNTPGKASEYLLNTNTRYPHNPGQSDSGDTYRTGHETVYSQPVRVVAKANFTDPILSSSMHNIPNGLLVYPNQKGTSSMNQLIYDTKHMMNQSTPSLNMRENAYLNDHDTKSTFGTMNPNMSPENSTSQLSSSSPSHRAHVLQQNLSPRDKLMPTGNKLSSSVNYSSNSQQPPSTTRSSGESLYSSQHRPKQMTYSSDSNLVQPREFSIIDRINSTSSSNESVCSASSKDYSFSSSASTYNPRRLPPSTTNTWENPSTTNAHLTVYKGSSDLPSQQPYNMPKKTRRSKDITRLKNHNTRDKVRVRTLYACLAENDGELSFEPNQIITNVRSSNEPGWLEGTLNGKSGLIPENYVEVLP